MTDPSSTSAFERRHDPTRVLSSSDGVCAIIITLLVLEIHVPELSSREKLSTALRDIQPSFVAFIISFVVVAIAWVGHRDLFALIRRTDRALVWLDVRHRFPLSLLPFGASLTSHHQQDTVALRIYGLILVAIALTRIAIWVYATGHPHLLFAAIDRRSRLAGIGAAAIPGTAYAIAFQIAGAVPTASLLIYALVPVAYFVGITVVRASAPSGAAERDFT